MKTIVAEGPWCLDCEFMEIADWDGDRCMACGCPRERHVPAQVIADEEGTCAD